MKRMTCQLGSILDVVVVAPHEATHNVVHMASPIIRKPCMDPISVFLIIGEPIVDPISPFLVTSNYRKYLLTLLYKRNRSYLSIIYTTHYDNLLDDAINDTLSEKLKVLYQR